MIIWNVIHEDSHTDTEAYPFSSEERAISFAKSIVDGYDIDPDSDNVQNELTNEMIDDDWVFFVASECPDFAVWIVKRELDAGE